MLGGFDFSVVILGLVVIGNGVFAVLLRDSWGLGVSGFRVVWWIDIWVVLSFEVFDFRCGF